MSSAFSLCELSDHAQVSIFGIAGTAPGLSRWHEDAVEPIERAIAAALKTRYGQDCTKNGFGIWTYACRDIRAGASHSEHAHPLAVDINAPKNGMSDAGILHTDFHKFSREDGAAFVNAFKRAGFRWGGDWSTNPIGPNFFDKAGQKIRDGRVDAMHFEYVGAPVSGPPTLSFGDEGPAVKRLQRRLKKWGKFTGTITGRFDVATRTAVKSFQKSKGLEADGVVGDRTWRKLLKPAEFHRLTVRSHKGAPLRTRIFYNSKRFFHFISKNNRRLAEAELVKWKHKEEKE